MYPLPLPSPGNSVFPVRGRSAPPEKARSPETLVRGATETFVPRGAVGAPVELKFLACNALKFLDKVFHNHNGSNVPRRLHNSLYLGSFVT